MGISFFRILLMISYHLIFDDWHSNVLSPQQRRNHCFLSSVLSACISNFGLCCTCARVILFMKPSYGARLEFQPIDGFPVAVRRELRAVLNDIDDTLTESIPNNP